MCVFKYFFQLDQELLSDAARRLCFQTYLSLSKLPFTMKAARNTNSMSPEGTSPFIVLQLGCEPLILCNFEKTVDFLEANVSMCYTKVPKREPDIIEVTATINQVPLSVTFNQPRCLIMRYHVSI